VVRAIPLGGSVADVGGGLSSSIANRRWAEGGADPDYTLTGIATGFGGGPAPVAPAPPLHGVVDQS
jgi:hypothetical protein